MLNLAALAAHDAAFEPRTEAEAAADAMQLAALLGAERRVASDLRRTEGEVMAPGFRVRLQSLKARPDLNGEEGIVEVILEKEGRVGVRLLNSAMFPSIVLKVKRENLVVVGRLNLNKESSLGEVVDSCSAVFDTEDEAMAAAEAAFLAEEESRAEGRNGGAAAGGGGVGGEPEKAMTADEASALVSMLGTLLANDKCDQKLAASSAIPLISKPKAVPEEIGTPSTKTKMWDEGMLSALATAAARSSETSAPPFCQTSAAAVPSLAIHSGTGLLSSPSVGSRVVVLGTRNPELDGAIGTVLAHMMVPAPSTAAPTPGAGSGDGRGVEFAEAGEKTDGQTKSAAPPEFGAGPKPQCKVRLDHDWSGPPRVLSAANLALLSAQPTPALEPLEHEVEAGPTAAELAAWTPDPSELADWAPSAAELSLWKEGPSIEQSAAGTLPPSW